MKESKKDRDREKIVREKKRGKIREGGRVGGMKTDRSRKRSEHADAALPVEMCHACGNRASSSPPHSSSTSSFCLRTMPRLLSPHHDR